MLHCILYEGRVSDLLGLVLPLHDGYATAITAVRSSV